MRWNVAPAAAMSLFEMFSARLAADRPVDSIVFPVPVTLSVPLDNASRALPLVVSMSSPPPERVSVLLSLVLMTTALSSPVLNAFDEAVSDTAVPPLLPIMTSPPFSAVASESPASLIAPLSVTEPPVLLVMSAALP
ncbi:MAG: hypothetical protein AVDCRST_MAG85-3430 [uncultured Solirubrobacteraceae bacterium]|uniref:Uncharacterized protein n=1 Tax=uncultured Solirubrobacteraceae bacterium TaxID=1162706 RepID=A0A6J4TQT3_9ACTN|nr:MAG: hypothetical protein AVDCRST_MAG85-3430 [uncultured Solirubrobacteraceae bacterium]